MSVRVYANEFPIICTKEYVTFVRAYDCRYTRARGTNLERYFLGISEKRYGDVGKGPGSYIVSVWQCYVPYYTVNKKNIRKGISVKKSKGKKEHAKIISLFPRSLAEEYYYHSVNRT